MTANAASSTKNVAFGTRKLLAMAVGATSCPAIVVSFG